MTASPTRRGGASLSIRRLDRAVKERLRLRAARHGRSMAAEASCILREALPDADAGTGADLVAAIRRRFEPLGGMELRLPPRGPVREPPRFD
jgi:plasmid stability protein